jgi:signal transduction histidine kinase
MRDSDFLSVVSHELRTPITVIVGLAGMLAARRDKLTKDQVDECLDQIRRQGERMARRVADLLDLSQLEAGRFRASLASVNLLSAARLALDVAPAPDGTAVELTIPPDVRVVADSARLEQVLVNLLTNAYRHGGRAIRVEAHRDVGDVLLTVSDDGMGVAEDLVPDLFERYSRGPTIQDRGAGLGLSIVRALVEAFGGRVWYESGEPTGARFHIALDPPAVDLARGSDEVAEQVAR